MMKSHTARRMGLSIAAALAACASVVASVAASPYHLAGVAGAAIVTVGALAVSASIFDTHSFFVVALVALTFASAAFNAMHDLANPARSRPARLRSWAASSMHTIVGVTLGLGIVNATQLCHLSAADIAGVAATLGLYLALTAAVVATMPTAAAYPSRSLGTGRG